MLLQLSVQLVFKAIALVVDLLEQIFTSLSVRRSAAMAGAASTVASSPAHAVIEILVNAVLFMAHLGALTTTWIVELPDSYGWYQTRLRFDAPAE
jgi:hypothetical protein